MPVLLMLLTRLLRRKSLVADGALDGPVVGVVGVLAAGVGAVEPARAGRALELRRLMARRVAVVVSRSRSRWKGFAAGAAFIVIASLHVCRESC